MIVTIDGPAGAGKSSAAQALAKRLGFRFLNTGAMYRAVALAALERDVSHDDESLARLAHHVRLELADDRILLDGRDVTAEIRSPRVTAFVKQVADVPAVRQRMIQLQRQLAENQNVVTEGRDQGTEAFPTADCKFFLTASPAERARRRLREYLQRGEPVTFESILGDQDERDRQDANREFGRLEAAADSIEVSTDGLTPAEVVDRLETLVRAKQRRQAEPGP